MLEKIIMLISILDHARSNHFNNKTYISVWGCDVDTTVKARIRNEEKEIRFDVKVSSQNFDALISKFIDDVKKEFIK